MFESRRKKQLNVLASYPTGSITTESSSFKSIGNTKEPNKVATTSSVNIISVIEKFAKTLTGLFLSAIFFYCLAYFVPTIREDIPSLYRLVDLLIVTLERLYSFFWVIMDKIQMLIF